MKSERRLSQRLPVGFYMRQIIGDQPHRCFITDLSSIGLYAERLVEPFERNSNVVQVELPLPNTSDAIWAKGEVVYDNFDSLFHGTAIRFTAMAHKHQRLLHDWLLEAYRAETQKVDQSPSLDSEVVIFRPEGIVAFAA